MREEAETTLRVWREAAQGGSAAAEGGIAITTHAGASAAAALPPLARAHDMLRSLPLRQARPFLRGKLAAAPDRNSSCGLRPGLTLVRTGFWLSEMLRRTVKHALQLPNLLCLRNYGNRTAR